MQTDSSRIAVIWFMSLVTLAIVVILYIVLVFATPPAVLDMQHTVETVRAILETPTPPGSLTR